jgi:hypothetical protein
MATNRPYFIKRVERNRRRSAQIIAVLVKYGLADWLRKIPANRIQEWIHDDRGQPIPIEFIQRRTKAD